MVFEVGGARAPTSHSAVVFDDTAADACAVAQGLTLIGYQAYVAERPPMMYTPDTAGALLGEHHAHVAVWSVSPALSLYCAHLEALLDRHIFDGVGLLVITTDASKVREYFGARCGSMQILQKPVAAGMLLKALAYVTRPIRLV